jgi:hypothetical protein
VKAEKIYSDKSKWRLFSDNLVGGIGWGIGTILGAGLLFVLLGLTMARIRAIPFIGEFVYNVIIEVQRLQGR